MSLKTCLKYWLQSNSQNNRECVFCTKVLRNWKYTCKKYRWFPTNCRDNCTNLQYQLTSTKLKQTYETYLALHDALMVKKHPAELANLLATYEPNGTAMDMTIATLKRHKVAVLAAVTSPYSNGPIEGVNRLIKSLKRSCFGFKNQLNFFKRIYQITA